MAKRKLKKYLAGRTMVEMLAVLAIIGILSIGGVLEYKMALSRKKAADVAQGIAARMQAVYEYDKKLSPQVQSNTTTKTISFEKISDAIEGSVTQAKGTQGKYSLSFTAGSVEPATCRFLLTLYPKKAGNVRIKESDDAEAVLLSEMTPSRIKDFCNKLKN